MKQWHNKFDLDYKYIYEINWEFSCKNIKYDLNKVLQFTST